MCEWVCSFHPSRWSLPTEKKENAVNHHYTVSWTKMFRNNLKGRMFQRVKTGLCVNKCTTPWYKMICMNSSAARFFEFFFFLFFAYIENLKYLYCINLKYLFLVSVIICAFLIIVGISQSMQTLIRTLEWLKIFVLLQKKMHTIVIIYNYHSKCFHILE